MRPWVCTCAFGATWLHLAGCWGNTGLRKGQQAGWGGQPGLWAGRPQKGCQLEARGPGGLRVLAHSGVKLPGHLAPHHSRDPLQSPPPTPAAPRPTTGKAWEVPGQLQLSRSRLRPAPPELRQEPTEGGIPALWAHGPFSGPSRHLCFSFKSSPILWWAPETGSPWPGLVAVAGAPGRCAGGREPPALWRWAGCWWSS